MLVKKVRLLNAVDFAVVNYESATDIIIEKAKQRQSFGVFAMPVHGLVLAARNHPMAQAVQKAGLIVPDGQPIRWAMNLIFKANLKDRVYGPTLTLHVLQKAHEERLKVFLYGGSSAETLDRFVTFVNGKFPGANIVGKYREDKPDGNTLDIDLVNKLETNILLVGRGCPHQELWIANNTGSVHAVMMGVGAAFSFHAGVIAQAPKWMQNNGLEWLFRLFKEPRRLFKRYLVTNTVFLALILKQLIESKKNYHPLNSSVR